MCYSCLDQDIPGWSYESWKNYRTYYNSKETIPRNNCLDQDKRLPNPPAESEIGKCIQWGVIVIREIYPFEDDGLQVGIGVSDNEGRANRNYGHIISDGFKTTYYQENPPQVGHKINNKLPPCRTLHAVYWTKSRELTLTSYSPTPTGNFIKTIKFKRIKKQLQPLASVRTDFGVLNLIPSQRISSLESLCAKSIAKHITCLKNIDKLIIPKSCREEIGRAWIRFHAIVVQGIEFNTN